METNQEVRVIGSNRHFIVWEIRPGCWSPLDCKVDYRFAIGFVPVSDAAKAWVASQTAFPTGRVTVKELTKELSVMMPIDTPAGDEWCIKAAMEFYDAVEHTLGHFAIPFGFLPIGATFFREDLQAVYSVKLCEKVDSRHAETCNEAREEIDMRFGTIVRIAS